MEWMLTMWRSDAQRTPDARELRKGPVAVALRPLRSLSVPPTPRFRAPWGCVIHLPLPTPVGAVARGPGRPAAGGSLLPACPALMRMRLYILKSALRHDIFSNPEIRFTSCRNAAKCAYRI